jgi:hypothetical protein
VSPDLLLVPELPNLKDQSLCEAPSASYTVDSFAHPVSSCGILEVLQNTTATESPSWDR